MASLLRLASRHLSRPSVRRCLVSDARSPPSIAGPPRASARIARREGAAAALSSAARGPPRLSDDDLTTRPTRGGPLQTSGPLGDDNAGAEPPPPAARPGRGSGGRSGASVPMPLLRKVRAGDVASHRDWRDLRRRCANRLVLFFTTHSARAAVEPRRCRRAAVEPRRRRRAAVEPRRRSLVDPVVRVFEQHCRGCPCARCGATRSRRS